MTQLYTDQMLHDVSEPSNQLVTDGRYVNLMIVENIRDDYEEALAEQEIRERAGNNAVLVISSQPDPNVEGFLEQLEIPMLADLLNAIYRVEQLINRKLAQKRQVVTPKTETVDYDDIGDDKRGEGT